MHSFKLLRLKKEKKKHSYDKIKATMNYHCMSDSMQSVCNVQLVKSIFDH